jgi:hypothetical protein
MRGEDKTNPVNPALLDRSASAAPVGGEQAGGAGPREYDGRQEGDGIVRCGA